MTSPPEPNPIIIRTEKYPVTDELFTEFYTCPGCFFQRVPHGRYDMEYDAKYCPGCGRELEWI